MLQFCGALFSDVWSISGPAVPLTHLLKKWILDRQPGCHKSMFCHQNLVQLNFLLQVATPDGKVAQQLQFN